MGKRKRTGLSLHRVKRRHGDAVNKSTTHTARFTPSHIYSANCTPLRLTPVSTPVKQYKRVITPLSSVKKKKNPRITSTPVKEHNQTILDETILYDEESQEITEEQKRFLNIVTDTDVLNKLAESKLLYYFTMFFVLVKRNVYPLRNIALLLWLETVKWYNCNTLQNMRFWKETKNFWRAGYRLFKGKFITFMSGPRCIGAYVLQNSENRTLEPKFSGINFAIPSRNFFISNKESVVPSTLKPGVITQAIDSIKTKVNMMCLDAKKVTAGLDNDYGDVDMFGHEGSPTLEERRQRLKYEQDLCNDIKTYINENRLTEDDQVIQTVTAPSLTHNKVAEVIDMVRAVLFVVTLRIKDARSLIRKQEYGLKKLKERAGTDWRQSKYVFAISYIQTYLFRVKSLVSRALANVDRLCEIASYVNKSTYKKDPIVCDRQINMFHLKPYELQEKPVPTQRVKQRNDLWYEIRKLTPVTGSTLHNALGLKTLAKQKQHYDEYVLLKEKAEPSDQVKVYLEHGAQNEKHGIATLVGKFLPAFHPDLVYIEEGCYQIFGENCAQITVSPDGSLRRVVNDNGENEFSECVAAVEIKCPYPKPYSDPVHYTLPNYYVCQCLAEMKALGSRSMIYLSYSKESSTFFEIDFDADLWKILTDEIEEIYGNDNVKNRPTKLRPCVADINKRIEEFVERNVRLLVEIPSVEMACNDLCNFTDGSNSSSHESKIRQSSEPLERTVPNQMIQLLTALTESSEIIQEGYQLSRRKANEVMVWVLSNKDRQWSAELPNSLIVAYGMKDYQLSSDLLRKATEEVLSVCTEKGLEIPVLAFDGQWSKLIVRGEEGNPLTKLELQKDVWEEVLKMKKRNIVDKLVCLNKIEITDRETRGLTFKKEKESMTIQATDHAFQTVRTSTNLKHWRTKDKKAPAESDDKEENNSSQMGISMSWIPENVIEAVEKSGDSDLMNALTSISKDIDTLLSSDEVVTDSSSSNVTNQTGQNGSSTSSSSQVVLAPIKLQLCDYKEMKLTLEKTKRLEKWKRESVTRVQDILSSAETLKICTKQELLAVLNKLKQIGNVPIKVGKNCTKVKLINFICEILGLEKTLPTAQKLRKIPTLAKLAEKVLRGKLVPKQILNIAYSQYLFPTKLEEWKLKCPLSTGPAGSMIIDDCTITSEWYSYPETNKATGKLLWKALDSHHLLTNLRIRTSTIGMANISPDAWKKVASSFKTKLTPAMVEDLTDKQSNAFAQTHFSKEVEDQMIENGDMNEAELCSLVRRWYEAEDQPALSASERVIRWLEMKEYILKDVDFGLFPPNMGSVKGFTRVAFEGFLVGIDTKIQLYKPCGSYCVRTVSSLPAETAVGAIQDMNINRSMSVRANDIPRILSGLTEIMTYKLNPDRGFYMKTSRSAVYPVVLGNKHIETEKDADELNRSGKEYIQLLDHGFDLPQRRRTRARRKLGMLTSDLDAPPKGTLSMRREFHKCDESKVLPTKRAGLCYDSIADLI